MISIPALPAPLVVPRCCWVDILPKYSILRLYVSRGSQRTARTAAGHSGIARAIQQTSQEELLVEHGALYPALQRLEERGWISAKWGVSSNNRKARFYALTA